MLLENGAATEIMMTIARPTDPPIRVTAHVASSKGIAKISTNNDQLAPLTEDFSRARFSNALSMGIRNATAMTTMFTASAG